MEYVRIDTGKIPLLVQHPAAGMAAYLMLKGKAVKTPKFNGLTIEDLMHETGLSRPTLQRVLRELVNDDLVTRKFMVEWENYDTYDGTPDTGPTWTKSEFKTLKEARKFSSGKSGYLAPTRFFAK